MKLLWRSTCSTWGPQTTVRSWDLNPANIRIFPTSSSTSAWRNLTQLDATPTTWKLAQTRARNAKCTQQYSKMLKTDVSQGKRKRQPFFLLNFQNIVWWYTHSYTAVELQFTEFQLTEESRFIVRLFWLIIFTVY